MNLSKDLLKKIGDVVENDEFSAIPGVLISGIFQEKELFQQIVKEFGIYEVSNNTVNNLIDIINKSGIKNLGKALISSQMLLIDELAEKYKWERAEVLQLFTAFMTTAVANIKIKGIAS